VLLAAIHRVPGVLGVASISLSGVAMPASLPMPEGHFLDCLTPNLRIGSTLAGPRLLAAK